MRFIIPIILIGISVTLFLTVASPFYNNISQLRTQESSYNDAISNANELVRDRDALTKQDNAISEDDKAKLKKLLPENVDNIRLILEIEKIALPYGMTLKNIQYSVIDTAKNTAGTAVAPIQGGGAVQDMQKDYGVWDLQFSTTGSYSNFLNFLKDLESNLRIVDISAIQFSSDANSAVAANGAPVVPSVESYKYDFKIKTYWLKN